LPTFLDDAIYYIGWSAVKGLLSLSSRQTGSPQCGVIMYEWKQD